MNSMPVSQGLRGLSTINSLTNVKRRRDAGTQGPRGPVAAVRTGRPASRHGAGPRGGIRRDHRVLRGQLPKACSQLTRHIPHPYGLGRGGEARRVKIVPRHDLSGHGCVDHGQHVISGRDLPLAGLVDQEGDVAVMSWITRVCAAGMPASRSTVSARCSQTKVPEVNPSIESRRGLAALAGGLAGELAGGQARQKIYGIALLRSRHGRARGPPLRGAGPTVRVCPQYPVPPWFLPGNSALWRVGAAH